MFFTTSLNYYDKEYSSSAWHGKIKAQMVYHPLQRIYCLGTTGITNASELYFNGRGCKKPSAGCAEGFVGCISSLKRFDYCC